MDRKRKKPLDFEPLEGKQLLSTLHAVATHHTTPASVAVQGFSIAGTIQSPISSISTFTANGQNYGTFTFHGRVKTMGAIHGAFVAAVDSTSTYMSSGMMKFIGKKGTVDLSVSPAPNDPSSYLFTISSGTGAFANATGSGKIQTHSYASNLASISFAITMNA